ncbi:rubrerythrin-like domain-containing protein [Natrinema soli]|uniref:Rubrerythrin-like domain-containing protein n=1 Tax=Natrinema soli TaxID=1930624 RepID=A0ABD5SMY6_9EURY|nr:rubrerythrin-like domain-containing protein [Natrinema soli]
MEKLIISESIVIDMRGENTYEKSPPYTYECMECGHRMTADHQPMECTECEGEMLNLSKPQE